MNGSAFVSIVLGIIGSVGGLISIFLAKGDEIPDRARQTKIYGSAAIVIGVTAILITLLGLV